MLSLLLQLLLPLLVLLALAAVVWAFTPMGRAAIREKWTGQNRYDRAAERALEEAPKKEPSAAIAEAVERQFPESERPDVLDLLSRYGADSDDEGRDRVHRAILKLSEGSLDEVRRNVQVALLDFRDVLFAANHRD